MGKTRITTRLWSALTKIPRLKVGPWPSSTAIYYDKVKQNTYKGYAVNRIQLQKIATLCEQHNVKFIVSIIPEIPNLDITTEELDVLLNNLPNYVKPKGSTLEDYKGPSDGHFNEAGHRKYAAFLDSLIRDLPTK